jgi:hypothetical protein
MIPSSQGQAQEERFFKALLEAAIGLQAGGADPEVTLEALIAASRLLTERLEGELQELRQEQAD